MSGINTLLQTLVGTRLPTIMNASFAFVIPVLSIAKEVESQNLADNHEVMVLISQYLHFYLYNVYPRPLSGFGKCYME
jgi:xanthine/uracil permease